MFNNNEVKMRFRAFLKINKIKHYFLAEKIGLTRNAVQGWCDPKKDAAPNCVAVCYLIAEYNLNPVWLLTGDGEMTTDGDNNSQNQTINQNYNLGNPKIFNGATNCENCPFPRTVEKLTEQIEKLSQKLIEKS